ncbi:unnamed protein product (mitochondrion) [Plasmodiophora brassicae]|uniref:Uncharacterized protein n=1 Tax=Plasmodiophora brassicae TaxID=37360 RepID=A0A0G4J2V0_PLABS|nr:hypothetical protein PBRA_002238 [Plasmodiophora brassicae]SPQ98831.1 unnamed protein product [Plasmodiophora brassicae]
MVNVQAAAKKKKEKAEKKKEDDAPAEEDALSEVEDLEPIEVHMVPDDQIKGLTEEQLSEEFTKALNANNPQAPMNQVLFDFALGQFVPMPPSDQIAVHFSMQETIIPTQTSEPAPDAPKPAEASPAAPAASEPERPAPGGSAPAEPAAIVDAPVEAPVQPPDSPNTQKAKALKNQFNFSERASQTFNNPARDRMVATEPPPTVNFSGLCSQFILFDAYLAIFREGKELKAQKDQQQASTRKQHSEEDGEDPASDMIIADADDRDEKAHKIMSSDAMKRAMKVMERIVNLNAEEDIFHDFKYFEDDNDKSREDGAGFFLPLWRFASPKAKRRTVTSIKWNPHYPDMFAVAFGSYDFMQQSGGGLICCYSLKNTSHPEFSFTTTSGIMCLAFHPQHPALLAVGLYDGSVCVYDVRLKNNMPIYQSLDPKVKHTDPVWEVHWQSSADDIGKEINFFSVSADGRVTDWIMSKNELVNEEIMELKLVSRKVTNDQTEIDDERTMVGLAGGTCFDFNPFSEHLFVVGTDEGSIHTCSKAYNSQYLTNFAGHHMAVYAVKWNPFHRGVFLSCSADWTVRLWESTTREPLLSFDLGSAVGDIAWAPYSSTAFAAVTADGKVFLFDLNVNKYEAVGQQRVIKKGKLTHVVFNSIDPILLCGDDRGGVMSLKLSPNLRRMSAKTIKEIKKDVEIAKLDAIMAIAAKKDAFP